MKRWPFLLCLWAAACLPRPALGDGGFIPATAFAKMEIPDQRALIQFANGQETLVIDTAFKGDGTNFAWIVPVPSKPEVEAATTGLFTTLQFVFQPRVYHEFNHYFFWCLFPGGCLFWSIYKLRKGLPLRAALWEGVMLAVLFLILGGLLLPTLATAGASAVSTGQVSVIERKTVGIYDTATISSPDGAALLDWLGKNGFATPTNFLPAIRAYAKEGWFFVASKVRLDAPMNEPAKAHPLSFTFKTTRPVYPLRLTGINNPHCKIELYVFGSQRAEIPNFKIERCEQPLYFTPGDKSVGHRVKSDELTIGHPGLQKMAASSPVATKLTGDLTSQQMQADGYINWAPFAQKRPLLFSYDGASLLAANIAVPILVVAGLIYYLAFGVVLPWGITARKSAKIMVPAAVLISLVVYFGVPKTTVTVSRMPGLRTAIYQQEIPEALVSVWRDEMNQEPKPDSDWIRRQLAGRITNKYVGSIRLTNYFFGLPMREEDSPGNYTLRETTNGIDYLWYDVDGAVHVEPLFQPKKTR